MINRLRPTELNVKLKRLAKAIAGCLRMPNLKCEALTPSLPSLNGGVVVTAPICTEAICV